MWPPRCSRIAIVAATFISPVPNRAPNADEQERHEEYDDHYNPLVVGMEPKNYLERLSLAVCRTYHPAPSVQVSASSLSAPAAWFTLVAPPLLAELVGVDAGGGVVVIVIRVVAGMSVAAGGVAAFGFAQKPLNQVVMVPKSESEHCVAHRLEGFPPSIGARYADWQKHEVYSACTLASGAHAATARVKASHDWIQGGLEGRIDEPV